MAHEKSESKEKKKHDKKKAQRKNIYIFFQLLLKEKKEKEKGPRKKWEQGKKMAQEKKNMSRSLSLPGGSLYFSNCR